VIRKIARIVYEGPIESLTTGPDGTLLASDGTQLLRLRPDEFGEAFPVRTAATPRLNLSVIADPTGPKLKLEIGGLAGGYFDGLSRGYYQIEMSGDLKSWTPIDGSSSLQAMPLVKSGRYYRVRTVLIP